MSHEAVGSNSLRVTNLIEHSDKYGRVVAKLDHEPLRFRNFSVIAVSHLVHIVKEQVCLAAELDTHGLWAGVDAAQEDFHLDGFKRAWHVSFVNASLSGLGGMANS